jgi:hypothetical protein
MTEAGETEVGEPINSKIVDKYYLKMLIKREKYKNEYDYYYNKYSDLLGCAFYRDRYEMFPNYENRMYERLLHLVNNDKQRLIQNSNPMDREGLSKLYDEFNDKNEYVNVFKRMRIIVNKIMLTNEQIKNIRKIDSRVR